MLMVVSFGTITVSQVRTALTNAGASSPPLAASVHVACGLGRGGSRLASAPTTPATAPRATNFKSKCDIPILSARGASCIRCLRHDDVPIARIAQAVNIPTDPGSGPLVSEIETEKVMAGRADAPGRCVARLLAPRSDLHSAGGYK